MLPIKNSRMLDLLRRCHAMAAMHMQNASPCYDVVIIGGGIVGTATARQLSINKPNLKMALLEKEPELGRHQTGHNSGVIHAGIYYKPGSLKAKLCVEGMRLAYEYCDNAGIPYKKIGKLIVACDNTEIETLNELYERSKQNGCPGVRMLETSDDIRAIEPNCRGMKAIWSPNTGIVDWAQVNRSYGDDFVKSGGNIITGFKVTKICVDMNDTDGPISVISNSGRTVRTKHVIVAAGLHSDRLARLTGGKALPKIAPFRGEYLVLKRERNNLVRTNIYPVPDPRFPFLGVHFTPRMDGSVWLGPNAVLAFSREGYTYSDIDLRDLWQTITFGGFLKLASKYLTAGLDEFYRSVSMHAQVKQLQRFVPSITVEDIDPERKYSGVRAQALDGDGNLVDDFVFEIDQTSGRILHVRNAPSPGATSSLAIAKVVADKAQTEFSL